MSQGFGSASIPPQTSLATSVTPAPRLFQLFVRLERNGFHPLFEALLYCRTSRIKRCPDSCLTSIQVVISSTITYGFLSPEASISAMDSDFTTPGACHQQKYSVTASLFETLPFIHRLAGGQPGFVVLSIHPSEIGLIPSLLGKRKYQYPVLFWSSLQVEPLGLHYS